MPAQPYLKRKAIPCKYFAAGKCVKPGCPFLHSSKPVSVPSTDMLTAMLRLLFEKNNSVIYGGNGVLVLSNFKQCPDLEGVVSSIDFNTVSFCNALAKTIKEKVAAPEFINVSDNDIKSMYHFLKALIAHDVHQTLKGISVANNRISTFDFVKTLCSFPQLNEVVFSGNPIADDAEYHANLRKIPGLLGIDGRGIERAPLGLPWPIPSQHSEMAVTILGQLEQAFFGGIAQGGVDSVAHLYSPQCMLSLSFEEGAEFHTPANYPKAKKDIPKDFVALRLNQQSLNRNVLKGVRTNRAKIGRVDVASALKDSMYPPRFTVTHSIDPNADLQLLNAGVKEQMVVLTLHGTMQWKHRDQEESDDPTARTFSRTMVLTSKDSGIQITNDIIDLKLQQHHEAVLLPSNLSRVATLAQRYQLDAATVQQIVAHLAETRPEGQEVVLHDTLNAIRRMGAAVFAECVQQAGNSTAEVILCVRAVEHYRITPAAALQALKQTGGDLAAIETLKGSMGPECFITLV